MGKDYSGKILVDSRTAEAATGNYRFTPLSTKLILKGVEEPVQTFYPKSFARGRSMSAMGVSHPTVAGRESEARLCLDPLKSMGKGQLQFFFCLCQLSMCLHCLVFSLVCSSRFSFLYCTVICFLGKPGFGKSALLRYISNQADQTQIQNHEQQQGKGQGGGSIVRSILITSRQTHIAIPFYSWRALLLRCLIPLMQAAGIHQSISATVVEDNGGLFVFCKPEEDKNVEDVSIEAIIEGKEQEQKLEPSTKLDTDEGGHQDIVAFLSKRWENSTLLRHILPALGIQKEITSKDIQIDGCLVSVEELEQLAALFHTIIFEWLTLDTPSQPSNKRDRFLIVCDDIDLFDRHSLLLMQSFVKKIPPNITVVLSSTESSATKAYTGRDGGVASCLPVVSQSASQTALQTAQHNPGNVHFPFTPLNFRHERHDFVIHTMLQNNPNLFKIIQLPSITLTHSIDVFEQMLGQKFGIDVAAKAVALSGGNLIMAQNFLAECLDTPGLLVLRSVQNNKKRNADADGAIGVEQGEGSSAQSEQKEHAAKDVDSSTTASLCFSPGVEDGSLKLPWGSNLITAQLDLFDVFTRQLAQILSVLGVDVDMKAILSIDILFQSPSDHHLHHNNSSPALRHTSTQVISSTKIRRTSSNKQTNDSRIAHSKSSLGQGVETRVQKIENTLATLVAAEVLVCAEISLYDSSSLTKTSSKNKIGSNEGSSNAGRGGKNYEWGFASSQVRAAVYSSMTFGVRQGIHAALTQYYRLTFPNDLSHFASIISYHAEASGDIDLAVETSFDALLSQQKEKSYISAQKNLTRCIGLLLQNTRTKKDQKMLIGCYLRDVHYCIIMGKMDLVASRCALAENMCTLYFQNVLPDAVHSVNNGGTGRRSSNGGLMKKLFGCCSKNPVRTAHATAIKIQHIMKAATLANGNLEEAAEKTVPKLIDAYERLHADMLKRAAVLLTSEMKLAQKYSGAPANMKVSNTTRMSF